MIHHDDISWSYFIMVYHHDLSLWWYIRMYDMIRSKDQLKISQDQLRTLSRPERSSYPWPGALIWIKLKLQVSPTRFDRSRALLYRSNDGLEPKYAQKHWKSMKISRNRAPDLKIRKNFISPGTPARFFRPRGPWIDLDPIYGPCPNAPKAPVRI